MSILFLYNYIYIENLDVLVFWSILDLHKKNKQTMMMSFACSKILEIKNHSHFDFFKYLFEFHFYLIK